MNEPERVGVVEAYIQGSISAAGAALRLGISERQLRRLRVRFVQDGAEGLTSRRIGRPSNNQLSPELVQRALELVGLHYSDFAPTLACEMLSERHGVLLSKEALRRLMINAGLWTPRAARLPRLHQPRERRPCVGDLVQIDGSRHAWFEERAPACTLLAFVDDATSRLMHLHFAPTETTAAYFDAMHIYFERHGKPQALYADRAAVFRSPAANKHVPTQFQRAVDELGVKLICANSPQAKGRVERANRTLQDRLTKQMRLDGINSIEAANAWIGAFIDTYNERFEQPARSPLDRHTPLHARDDLCLILSMQETRKLSTKLTVQHGRLQYVLKDEPGVRALAGRQIVIHQLRSGDTELRCENRALAYTVLIKSTLPAAPAVTSKEIHHAIDLLTPSTPKKVRPYVSRRTANANTQGVSTAKKAAADKRASAV